ncbi:MAG: hypothetical protein HKN25_02165 [Pyrinomonadaceae bacterium]|nr:hypothetical protein [Pyrinomonadaceae bacterium]
MKKCQSCSYENSDLMNFCLECGSALADVSKMVVPIEGADTEVLKPSDLKTDSFEKETVVNNDRFGFKQSTPAYVHGEKPGSNVMIYVAIAGVLLLLGFGVVAAAAGIIYATWSPNEPRPLAAKPKPTPNTNGDQVPTPLPDEDLPPLPENPKTKPRVNNDVITFPTPSSPTQRGTFRIKSGSGWQLSNIKTVPNQDFRVLVKGRVKLAGIGKYVSAKGMKGYEDRRVYKKFPTGALLMRTHYPDGRHSAIQPVALGQYWKNEPNETGKIEFLINDNSPEGNTVKMTVIVTKVDLKQN